MWQGKKIGWAFNDGFGYILVVPGVVSNGPVTRSSDAPIAHQVTLYLYLCDLLELIT